MGSAGGHWVRVRFADASSRLDWVPAEQPPAPDGRAGAWHVVPDAAGGPSRWEWHPGSSARPAPAPLAAPAPADPQQTSPLPLQAVPNRPRRGAPSVWATPPRTARPVFPLRMRWAVWSLSVALAVPVVYLLARPSDDGAARPTGLQSAIDDVAADSGADASDALPGVGATRTAPGTGADSEATERYLTYLTDLDSAQRYSFGALGEEYLTSAGAEACAALDDGSPYDSVRQSVLAKVPNGGHLMVAAAATYLCPRHHQKLQSFTAALR